MTIEIEKFIKYCKKELPEAKVIFDIGTEDARDALKFKNSFPDASVWAFEGNPFTYKKYSGALEQEPINYTNLVLSDKISDSASFYAKTDKFPGISSLRNRGNEYPGQVIDVKTTTIEHFCSENNISNIDVVKLDVEGCTYEVLKGFGKLLSTVKIFHLETERYQYFDGQILESEVFDLLKENGFVLTGHSRCFDHQYDSVWKRKS
jgi:FkbM family methyltransferase